MGRAKRSRKIKMVNKRIRKTIKDLDVLAREVSKIRKDRMTKALKDVVSLN